MRPSRSRVEATYEQLRGVVIKTVTAVVKAIRGDRNKFVRNGVLDHPNAR